MAQTPLPLTPKKAVLAGLAMMFFPLVVYFFAYWPVESFMELLDAVMTGWGGGEELDMFFGFIMVIVLFGSFTFGIWEFSRGIFLLLFGDWYESKQIEKFESNYKQRQQNKLLKEREIYARISAKQSRSLKMRNGRLRSIVENIKKPFKKNPTLLHILIIVVSLLFLIFIFTL